MCQKERKIKNTAKKEKEKTIENRWSIIMLLLLLLKYLFSLFYFQF